MMRKRGRSGRRHFGKVVLILGDWSFRNPFLDLRDVLNILLVSFDGWVVGEEGGVHKGLERLGEVGEDKVHPSEPAPNQVLPVLGLQVVLHFGEEGRKGFVQNVVLDLQFLCLVLVPHGLNLCNHTE